MPSVRGFEVTVNKGKLDETVYKDKAIQTRLTPGVPRQVLKELKQHVQADRRAEQQRVL